MSHQNIHRRHARAAIPDPHAIADALANAIPDPIASAIANANPFAKASASPKASPQQVVTVYTTASATFDGPTAGMTTYTSASSTPAASSSPTADASTPVASASQSAADTQAPTETAQSSIAVDTSAPSSSVASSSVAVNTNQASQSSSLPASIVPTTTVPTSVALAAATGSVSSISSHKASSTATAASSTATADSSSSGGMSTGGKAGLAIGIILLIGAALALAIFFVRKRKAAANHDRLDDEKNDVFEAQRQASVRSNRTAPNAPQLSLRPITQFTPTFNEKTGSSTTPTARNLTPASPWERQMGGQEQNKANPFGNHAEAIDATNANGPPVVKDVGPGGEIVAGALVAGAATDLARGASKRENGNKPLDFTTGGTFMGPPSPVGTEFSTSSDPGTPTQTSTGAAIAAAGGPPNSTVHRVQLDFKPSMGDEIELRAGQLIRMLHEYDDGWALCIRLDRSQQGVVPRTCLSTRPVKPRPQQNGPRGPPPGMRVPQSRPMSPANQSPRSMTPNGPPGNRPMGPNGSGRPMTPTNPQYSTRPMTPNSDGRPRSPSVAQNQGPRASPGQSRMNPAPQVNANSPQGQFSLPSQGFPPAAPVGRKPVPGQAL